MIAKRLRHKNNSTSLDFVFSSIGRHYLVKSIVDRLYHYSKSWNYIVSRSGKDTVIRSISRPPYDLYEN